MLQPLSGQLGPLGCPGRGWVKGHVSAYAYSAFDEWDSGDYLWLAPEEAVGSPDGTLSYTEVMDAGDDADKLHLHIQAADLSTIPDDATITGLLAVFYVDGTAVNAFTTKAVDLDVGGGIGWHTPPAASWPVMSPPIGAEYPVGGPKDIWNGTVLTPYLLKTWGIDLYLQPHCNLESNIACVDAVKVTVYYKSRHKR
jgi:hypothetical protein